MAGRCAHGSIGTGRRPERGAALLVFLVLLVMAGLSYLLDHLSSEAIRARRDQSTDDALGQARDALLGYALKFREEQLRDGQHGQVYGYLPLPDLGSTRNNNPGCTREGCDAAEFAGNGANISAVGRLPWRTLGIPPLRDGHGECLWYAVSGSHQRIQQASPMNWDAPGHFDIAVANGAAALAGTLAHAHQRPIAVVFSPGPALAGQDRGRDSRDAVDECGGNYDARNYLDPGGVALDGNANHFAGSANAASGNASASPKTLSTAGMVQRQEDGRLWAGACPPGARCAVAANDRGLALTGDGLFGALRKSAHFRGDIDTLLDSIAACLRDDIAAGKPPAAPYARIAGADGHPCYGKDAIPLGYYPHYKDMIFVAAPGGDLAATVDGIARSCAAALLFAGQRDAAQRRGTMAERNAPANYLEGVNLASFTGGGTRFAGPERFARVSPAQAASQDILRCIPAGASLASVESARLAALGAGQLARYDAATRTLTLGREAVTAGDIGNANAGALFGCAWQPEAHRSGGGLRAYFKFHIQRTGTAGDGFVFALVDGDANGADVCGAARQHLGYAGNNGQTPAIRPPKIGIEVDTRRNYRPHADFTDPPGFHPGYVGDSPASASHLNNGRADPDYAGGHVAIVYWGGEAPIGTGRACGSGCTAPQFCSGGVCYLTPEEDDNVHGRAADTSAARPPPRNPAAPASPAAPPAGVYKLDPGLSQVPTNQDIHVRVELTRDQPDDDYNSRPVRVVATAEVALAGLQTIDGVALAPGDRVLVVGQTDGAGNGVHVAAAGPWTRAAENDATGMPPDSAWIVRQGAAHAWTYWRLDGADGHGTRIVRATPGWRAVTTAPVALAGLPHIGGVQLAPGDRVLVTAQADAADNGLYQAQAGAWTRIHMYRGDYRTQVWILKHSATEAKRIAYMKMTPRPIAELDAGFTPHLSDRVTIHSPAAGACDDWRCPDGQWCGLDGVCYRPAFRTLRLGFTNAQGTTDQVIDVSDFGATWLP